MQTAPAPWTVVHRTAAAAELVRPEADELDPGGGGGRLLVVCEVSDRAVVLGSTQPERDVDRDACAERGVSVVRRRSGGGAVFVAPGAQVWVDAYLPAGDPLLVRDVGASFAWFGRAWAEALATVLADAAGSGLAVIEPGRAATAWSRRLCFGGLGAGEVTLGGRKVVGISQRRDRRGAWFHSMAPLQETSGELVEMLALSRPESRAARELLEHTTDVVAADGSRLATAVVAALD